MLIALDVCMIDRWRGRVQVEDGRTLRIIAAGDHLGRPCSAVVASHAIAIDEQGRAYAVDVMDMAARPLGRMSRFLGSEESEAG